MHLEGMKLVVIDLGKQGKGRKKNNGSYFLGVFADCTQFSSISHEKLSSSKQTWGHFPRLPSLSCILPQRDSYFHDIPWIKQV